MEKPIFEWAERLIKTGEYTGKTDAI